MKKESDKLQESESSNLFSSVIEKLRNEIDKEGVVARKKMECYKKFLDPNSGVDYKETRNNVTELLEGQRLFHVIRANADVTQGKTTNEDIEKEAKLLEYRGSAFMRLIPHIWECTTEGSASNVSDDFLKSLVTTSQESVTKIFGIDDIEKRRLKAFKSR